MTARRAAHFVIAADVFRLMPRENIGDRADVNARYDDAGG